ncbi:DUF523 domain-containing protein [Clostridium ganghwense]|uniref:DUF523 domain-containing protein n=1 Tax=Clostridium ganghwense TaxID=312089 RepID=A0ABT4CQY3_9CLOT|nr:DUF523 domain-containing protein [Clostridium ganghwense]MCY6371328.1 DUF523 domain-containing protein [Clostridium ganghwense]
MYLVSACLAGVNCRYNGGNSKHKTICELVKEGKAIPICPEQLSGLPTPRACCEIIIDESGNKKIMSEGGQDFTKEFIEGAEKTLEIARIIGVEEAILQSRSPSCGYGCIYDGTFSGNFKEGYGFTAELLAKNGIEVYTENDLDKLEL